MQQAMKFSFPLLAVALMAMFVVNAAQGHVVSSSSVSKSVPVQQAAIGDAEMHALAVMMNEIEPQSN